MSFKTSTQLVLVYIFFTSFLLSNNNGTTLIDSTSNNKSQINVGEVILETQSSLDIYNKPKKWYNSSVFTTFMGSFLAAIIAILSIYFTNRNFKRNNKKIQSKKYATLLSGIKDEVINNEKITKLIKEEIDVYIETVKRSGKMVELAPFNEIKLSFIKECRLNIVDNDNIRTDLINFISRYIDKGEAVNDALMLNNLFAVQKLKPKNLLLYKAFKIYYVGVLELVDQLDSGSSPLQQVIDLILEDFTKYLPVSKEGSKEDTK